MRQIRLVLLMIAFVACNAVELQPRVVQSLPTLPKLVVQEPDVIAPPTVRTLAPPKTHDPYAEWNSWCESRATPCRTTKDCAPDRTGQARKCIKPYWASKVKKGEAVEKVCAIPDLERSERRQMQEQLQVIVNAVSTHSGNADALMKFFSLVALRESTWRAWKQHRLSGDVKYAKDNWTKSWKKLSSVNPYYADSDRWQGWGWLGQQSVTFAVLWDVKAPPEILCRPTVAVETYLRCMRTSHRKQKSLGIEPTWETLHSSCSGGNLRPKGPSEDFRKRAHRVGLDPTQPVPFRWLGVPPGHDTVSRNMTLATIETLWKMKLGEQDSNPRISDQSRTP